ncbi:MAG: hypothetical protein ACE5LV_05385, partial [Candidatus Aminicenantales bacterium]
MAAKTPCPHCQDTGWILKEVKGSVTARRCTCFEERRSEILVEQAGIPRRYANCTLKNFEIH